MKLLSFLKFFSSFSLNVAFCVIYHIIVGSANKQDMKFLRCAMIHSPPFEIVTYYKNGSSSNQGCSRTNVEWLSAKLKYSIEFIHPTEKQAKQRGNEAGVDMVANGEADFVGNGFAVTPERYPRLDIVTYPIWEEPNRMVVPRPGERDRLFAFTKPFTATVWLLLGLSFVVMSLFMGLLTWASSTFHQFHSNVNRENSKTTHHFLKYFLYNINMLTNHGDYLSESRASFLLGVTFWLLGASVLVYTYSSIVVSSITVPQMEPSVDSLEDVVSHPDISLILRTDTYIGSVINSSTRVPLYKALKEKAMKRPESIGSEGIINTAKLILTGKYAYPFIDTAVRYIASTLNNKTEGKKCQYQLSRTLAFSNSQFYLLFAKGTNRQIIREFTIGATYSWEVGLNHYCVRSLPLSAKTDKCFSKNTGRESARRMTSIKLVDLTSAFFILAVGAGIAFVTFLLEITYFRSILRR